MLRFFVLLPLRILLLPVLLALKVLFWVCTGLLCMSEWIFSLAGTVLFLLGGYALIFDGNMQGLAIMGIGFLVSPYGLPMLAMRIIMGLELCGMFIREKIY